METPSSPKSGIKTKKSKRNTKSHKSTKSNIDGDEDEKPADKSTLTHNQKPTNDLICNNYVLLKQIGHGAFGEIFLSFNLRDNIEVAIKREQKRIGKSVQLKTEAKVYQSLLNISQNQDLTGSIALSQETVHGVPKYYGVGELPDLSGYYLIMEFLGPNLNELFKFCGMRKFTISTCALLAIQMINRIENVHKHSFLHRDIKPENFMIGSQDASNVIYLVDFGLSKRYKNVRNNQHIPYREGRNLIGTARYVSISTHLGIEQSRRDDLESVGYVLIFFLKGFLPWQGMKGGDKYQRIMEKKLQIPTDILCLGLPEEMAVYMNYVKSLRFEDRPDYDHLRGLFIKMLSNCISTYGIDKEYIKFDWNFEDPKNTIWNIYKEKKKMSNPSFQVDSSSTGVKGNDNCNKDNKGKKVALLKRDLTNIIEDDIKEVKTAENNMEEDDDIDEEDDTESINNNKKEEEQKEKSENTEKDGDDKENDKDNGDNNVHKNTKVSKHSIPKDEGDNVDDIKEQLNPNNKDDNNNNQQQNANDDDDDGNNNSDNEKTKIIDNTNNTNNNNDNISEATVNEEFTPQNLQIPSTIPNTIGDIIKETTKEGDIKIENYINKLYNGISNSRVDPPLMTITDDFKEAAKDPEQERKEVEYFRRQSKDIVLQGSKLNNVQIHFSKENLIKIKKEPVSRHYAVQTDIGQGSYGKVKRVRHNKLGEERAMKIVSKQSESSQNEIEILRRVSHPNIVNIYEIFEDSKKYYIITEMLDGGELFEFITNQGTFMENDASLLMKQILKGVNYLHSNHIVHRDLKPENIMLVRKPNSVKKYTLKIIDFGTAITINPGQKINKFIGTSYYIAPEVLAENYNEKCDVWSCGVILYILLCGYPPFNGSSNVDIFHNIQYSQPMFNAEEWKDVSPSAIDLIKNMLNKNPSKRYTAEMCLDHKWFKENDGGDPFGLKGYNKNYNQLKAVNKMAEFVKENKFKQAVLQFITTQFDIQQEEENLREVFKQFDVEKTGQITKDVFLGELVKLYGEEDAKILTNKIFNTLDLDGNGDISYNEFLTSIIDSKKFITNDRLDKAFKLFDKDGNGKLSIEEIRLVFGGDENKWQQIIQDIDLNDDGEVDFEEFKHLMTGTKSRELLQENNCQIKH